MSDALAVDLNEERALRNARIDARLGHLELARQLVDAAGAEAGKAEITEALRLQHPAVYAREEDRAEVLSRAMKIVGGRRGGAVKKLRALTPQRFERPESPTLPRPREEVASAPRRQAAQPEGDRILMTGKLGQFEAVPSGAGGFDVRIELRGVNAANAWSLLDRVRTYLIREE